MPESQSVDLKRPDRAAQTAAILGPDIFKWAIGMLPSGVTIDDVRYRDLIDVSEDEVVSHVVAHGFDDRVVAQDRVEDDRICIVQAPAGWEVFYTERGRRSDEALFALRDDAVRDVVRRLMRLARTVLNHRYWHAHGLPFPCDDE